MSVSVSTTPSGAAALPPAACRRRRRVVLRPGPVGQDAQEVAAAARCPRSAPRPCTPSLQHALDVGDQRRVRRSCVKLRERPADVLRQDLEDLGDARRELADAQLAIEEHRRDVGAVQQVLDVVVELLQLGVLLLVLRVDGVELLVDRVQLLVRALQLLVRGDQLLVGRLQLLVGRLELLDRGLQVLLGVGELVFERAHVIARTGLPVDGRRPARAVGAPADVGERRHQRAARCRPSASAKRDQDVRQRALRVADRLGDER